MSAFNERSVPYMIAGGYAYARYTEPRTTKDLDLFIKPDPQSAQAVFRAIAAYGAPSRRVDVADFADANAIFQIGVAPFRVDLIFKIDGVTFDEASETAELALVEDEIAVRYISCEKLIANKLAAARPQDLVDADKLSHATAASSCSPMKHSGSRSLE